MESSILCHLLPANVPKGKSVIFLVNIFCVHSFFDVFMRMVSIQFLKHFYNVEQYEVTSLKRFVFSDPQATLQIHFERRFSEGWILTQDGGSSKVSTEIIVSA